MKSNLKNTVEDWKNTIDKFPLEIEAFKLLYSNLVGTTKKTDEISLF